jgi:hypothetical protein
MQFQSLLVSGLLAANAFIAAAQPNIDPAQAVSGSDFIGEFNWLPNTKDGAVINQYYCAGFIYGADVGWISLGAGEPADHFHYKNDSAFDFGVNVMPDGALRGYAYGANIGWISFSEMGDPRVEWITGKLLGRAWAANAGWIDLSSSTQFLRVAFLPDMLDSDGDGLPDAWEVQLAGNLTTFTSEGDADGDGQTDLQEYLAGTNPRDENDFFGPVTLAVSVDTARQTLQWPTKSGFVYRVQVRSAFDPSSVWANLDAPLVVGTGNITSIDLPVDPAAHLFYRVEAYPPLSAL